MRIPLLGSFIKNLEDDLRDFGFQTAMLNAVKRSGTKLIVTVQDPQTHRVLSEEPVLVVANHPHKAETIALIAALPPRNDAYLVVNYNFTHILADLDRHLIPAYTRHHIETFGQRDLSSKILRRFHKMPHFSPEEEHEKNIRSIQDAGRRILEGGLVVIFPGRGSVDGRWFSGVGHLIQNVAPSGKGHVIMAYIQGTSSRLDVLRIVPGMGMFLPSISVSFSPPFQIPHLAGPSAKDITAGLQSRYVNWRHSSTMVER